MNAYPVFISKRRSFKPRISTGVKHYDGAGHGNAAVVVPVHVADALNRWPGPDKWAAEPVIILDD